MRISDAGLKCAAHGSLQIQHAKNRKSPSGHHPTTLSGYIFTTKARIDNRKNLLSSNMSSTCSHNMVNFGPQATDISWRVWGTPANFNGFRVLAALFARHSSSGRQPNFAALNRGRHLYSAGRPSRWALAHISSYSAKKVKLRRVLQTLCGAFERCSRIRL